MYTRWRQDRLRSNRVGGAGVKAAKVFAARLAKCDPVGERIGLPELDPHLVLEGTYAGADRLAALRTSFKNCFQASVEFPPGTKLVRADVPEESWVKEERYAMPRLKGWVQKEQSPKRIEGEGKWRFRTSSGVVQQEEDTVDSVSREESELLSPVRPQPWWRSLAPMVFDEDMVEIDENRTRAQSSNEVIWGILQLSRPSSSSPVRHRSAPAEVRPTSRMRRQQPSSQTSIDDGGASSEASQQEEYQLMSSSEDLATPQVLPSRSSKVTPLPGIASTPRSGPRVVVVVDTARDPEKGASAEQHEPPPLPPASSRTAGPPAASVSHRSLESSRSVHNNHPSLTRSPNSEGPPEPPPPRSRTSISIEVDPGWSGQESKKEKAKSPRKPRNPDAPTFLDVNNLATKYQISEYEVHSWLKTFTQHSKARPGKLTYDEFLELLKGQLALYAASQEITPELEASIRRVTGLSSESATEVHLDFEGFVIWNLAMAFSGDLHAMNPEEAQLRQLARDMGLELPVLESTWSFFQRFDSDKSGNIERGEFEEMLRTMLGSTDNYDLPKERLDRYWKEIDQNDDGTLCFQEFLLFFTKHFKGSSPRGSSSGMKASDDLVTSVYRSLGSERLSTGAGIGWTSS